jgi:protein-L-isoaspartate(D-aspartate) O-methyltransferase
MTFFHPGANALHLSQQRRRLLDQIADDAVMTGSNTGRSVFSAKVMAAIGRVDRHRFVPDGQAYYAYENHPLPIGHGQTISQPYIVALMTDLLDLNASDRVLEIGTGSGYQAAVLAELAEHIYSVEIVAELGMQARAKLLEMGYNNVSVKIGDGWDGWPEHAPYDAIIVTAAPEDIPPALVQQLKPGGKIVIPLDSTFGSQDLILAEKQTDGSLVTRRLLPVRFVPLVGGS